MTRISPDTFERICTLVYESSGIVLGPRKEALVSARLGKRMRALGIADFDEYLSLVDEDDGEAVGMIDAVCTNVTSFFREKHHFEFLAEEAMRLYSEGRRDFRYWSAACSTGEEPYSLAMALRQVLPLDAEVKILATDLSTTALERAWAGVFDEDRLSGLSKNQRDGWFTPVRGQWKSAWQVKPIIRGMVTFGRVNLSAPPFTMRGPFDAVLCRNVMIYFDDAVRRGLLAEAQRLLGEDGYFIVGHAESLAGIDSGFQYVRPSVYRKRS